jgi:hypothetical protein
MYLVDILTIPLNHTSATIKVEWRQDLLNDNFGFFSINDNVFHHFSIPPKYDTTELISSYISREFNLIFQNQPKQKLEFYVI